MLFRSSIVESITEYRTALRSHRVHLSNVYVEYDYSEGITRLNLIVLVKENTDYIKLFADLRLVNPTIAISLANQVSI